MVCFKTPAYHVCSQSDLEADMSKLTYKHQEQTLALRAQLTNQIADAEDQVAYLTNHADR